MTPVRLIPLAALLLSGCAVGDAIGTGIAAIGDGTKYIVDRVGDEPAAGTAPQQAAPAAAPAPAPAADSRTVTAAPSSSIEVEPLD